MVKLENVLKNVTFGEFKELLFENNTKSFMVNLKSESFIFSQNKITETIKTVHCIKLYHYKGELNIEEIISEIQKKLEFFAIIDMKNKKIYLDEPYFIRNWIGNFEDYYDCFNIYNYIDMINNTIAIEVFQEAYENTPVISMEDSIKTRYEKSENKYYSFEEFSEKQKAELRENARKNILTKKEYQMSSDNIYPTLSKKDLFSILLNEMDIRDFLREKNTSDDIQKRYLYNKSYDYAVKDLMENHTFEIVEKEIYNLMCVLNNLEQKTITVEFKKGDIVASEKMQRTTLQNCILHRDDISSWDFITQTKGKELFEKLNIGYNKEYERLYPTDITKVLSKGKAVYLNKE